MRALADLPRFQRLELVRCGLRGQALSVICSCIEKIPRLLTLNI